MNYINTTLARIKKILHAVASIFIYIFILSTSSAFAEEPYTKLVINDLDGKPFFLINIANEGYTVNFDKYTYKSEFTLSNAEISALHQGMGYWVSVLDKYRNILAVPEISLFTIDVRDNNASAFSPVSPYGTGMTLLGDMIVGKNTYDRPVALIDIHRATYFDGMWYTGNMGSLPMNGNMMDLSAVMLHEMGHALGLLVSRDNLEGSDVWRFADNLSLWTQGLRNVAGEAPKSGGKIEDFLAIGWYDKTKGLYFTGAHVDQVLNGAKLGYFDDINDLLMPGIPVTPWEGNLPEFSHIELQNSLMSHQNYRNWNVYMEAELAMMQDIGYDIDRRNFFGYSVYNSNTNLTNTNPYFARNEEGTAFVEGAYNATPRGMGLHIYGSNNTITQAADILSSGIWGMGIRVDGGENTLTINQNTKVHANGLGGNALAVTYGKEHTIIHKGDLAAQGTGGIAARFDFGSNMMGNYSEYRGSWRREGWNAKKDIWGNSIPALDALQGSLVKSFDVTGSLAGNAAAIYISDNAHVANINIMKGAQISGDIISQWNPSWHLLHYSPSDRGDLLTNLTFGLKADADGVSTVAPDKDFSLKYTGNIMGEESLRMSIEGGSLTFNRAAEVLSVHVQANALLAGTGQYQVGLTDETYTGISQSFLNEGTLLTYDPSNKFDMSGLYIEAEDFDSTLGKLGVLVDGTGAVGGLSLAGGAANKPETFAKLLVSPAQDYYFGAVDIDLDAAVKNASSVSYTDNSLGLSSAFNSPTLNFAVRGDTSSAQLLATRSANAYRQYSSTQASYAPAAMLDGMASKVGAVNGDMRDLIAALDFSNSHTVGTALQQLSGAAYQSAGQAALQSQHAMTGAFIRHMLTFPNSQAESLMPTSGANPINSWHYFSSLFGTMQNQNNTQSLSGYSTKGIGLMGGAERVFDTGLTAGMHLALQHRQLDSDNADDATIKTDAISIGFHGIFKPTQYNGAYILGQVRGGLGNNTMERTINFNAYSRVNDTDWTEYIFSSTIGGGWDSEYENMLFGPVAWLDYSALIRPAFTENGGGASRLHYDNNTLHSLRSSLGGRFAIQHMLEKSQTTLQADFLLAWQHELLDNYGTSKVGFAGYEDFSVSQENAVQGRDSILLQLSAQARFSTATTLRLQVGSEFSSEKYSALMASVSLNWEF